MRILVVGSGGREHALAWKLGQSPSVGALFITPGNGGTAQVGENLSVPDSDVPALIRLARKHRIDLIVAGPELPLTLGLADAAAQADIPCFGPVAAAARLEGSKAFAKEIMAAAGVPTAQAWTFTDFDTARDFVQGHGGALVVKADGLAAGKGVVVCDTAAQAVEALRSMFLDKAFGEAGATVLVEERLDGEEASFLAFCDGHNVAVMPACQDHKRAFDADQGPNTGGMGAYSPAPILPESAYQTTADLVLRPIVRELARRGTPFRGVLYAGLMMTSAGPKVLEYNVRFGDPECQPLMLRFDGDLAAVMHGCATGRLDPALVRWKPQAALCVVMAAQGYPGSYAKGMAIRGIGNAESLDGVQVFQAGTSRQDGQVVSTGGRVLGVSALGADLAQAQVLAYQAVERIDFPQSFHRRDIGAKGLK